MKTGQRSGSDGWGEGEGEERERIERRKGGL